MDQNECTEPVTSMPLLPHFLKTEATHWSKFCEKATAKVFPVEAAAKHDSSKTVAWRWSFSCSVWSSSRDAVSPRTLR